MFLFIIGSKHLSGRGIVALQHLHSLINFLKQVYSFMSSLTRPPLIMPLSYIIKR